MLSEGVAVFRASNVSSTGLVGALAAPFLGLRYTLLCDPGSLTTKVNVPGKRHSRSSSLQRAHCGREKSHCLT